MTEFTIYYPVYYNGLKCYWQKLMDVFATNDKEAIALVTEQWGPPKAGFYKAVRKEN